MAAYPMKYAVEMANLGYTGAMWRVPIPVLAVACVLLSGVRPAAACGPIIDIQFMEDSGGDLFMIENKSEEPWLLVSLEIDLKGSFGRLIFDTDGGGLGESMHTPFAAGDDRVGLIAVPEVRDGSQEVFLQFSAFAPGQDFTFIVDTDDRLENSEWGQAHVTGPEMAGAQARAVVMMKDGERSNARGQFTDKGRAILRGGLCA